MNLGVQKRQHGSLTATEIESRAYFLLVFSKNNIGVGKYVLSEKVNGSDPGDICHFISTSDQVWSKNYRKIRKGHFVQTT